MDTIYALASAPGRAGVAVIRISGPDAHRAAEKLAGPGLAARGMVLRVLRDSQGERLDDALVLSFRAPGSFTGEDVVELQVHGSTAGVAAILNALSELENLRPAEAGEFTRRAMENGKLDLAQVEGLADLIDAETESQRRQANNLFSGKLGDLASAWRSQLVRAAALIEATIDFADEDVPVDVTPEVTALVSAVMAGLEREIAGLHVSERIRTGFEVAIIGPPNSGKSTLLNALAGRDAAITSEYAGTTRDVIEVRMDLGGLPVTLLDTAGLRETEDHVEGIGIALARKRARSADLRIFLGEDEQAAGLDLLDDDIRVLPKADLRKGGRNAVSGLTGAGVDELVQRVADTLGNRAAGSGLATRERHRVAMTNTRESLVVTRDLLAHGPDSYDIAADELRRGIRALESLVGRVDVENLLDEIFSSFCIGK
ncbi:tRNA uridine-5-carboxymethylaminomethyl(34) synthesis GTPase MnmE [Pukyongiella litopenaei]|uniref:tRNA modification GTPase MnmE n=1 Tax=Pukyongiella litopenaei TaxID=2605946 RepID=A0A2S0MPP5_9RHOB|nr:tRNA uridine-5-carboxymethylaminomethyl(34) synthesis GTPase MnmE [Pukyongiella litopenaei]AVO37845.1 tRNA uridine-5-carboxymethylaminomethyl(34) synthesis GTPase MnmE [Pukyongiella litopenaei]